MANERKKATEKISIADCRKMLCKRGKIYNDDEIISIRDLIYCLAQVDIDTYYHQEEIQKEVEVKNKDSTQKQADEKDLLDNNDSGLDKAA